MEKEMETKKMTRPYPWLIYPTQRNQFFCPLPISISDSETRPRIRSIPALRGLYTKIVYSSSYGGSNWHLILKNHSHLFIWNQNNSNSITLPLLPEDYADISFLNSIMFFSASAPKCSVLLFYNGIQSILLCEINIHDVDETRTWSVTHYGETMREMFNGVSESLHSPVFHNGELYAMNQSLIINIKVVDGQLFFQPTNYSIPKSDLNGIRCCIYFLHSVGDLVIIYITLGGVSYKEIIDFEIYQLDVQANNWKKLVNSDCFNDRIFFLSDSYSFSCLTNNHDGGCVYFNNCGDKKSLYSYNIEDGSLTITLPCPNLSKPWELPYWILTDQIEQGDEDDDSENEDEDEEEDNSENEDEEEDDSEDEDEDEDNNDEEEEDSAYNDDDNDDSEEEYEGGLLSRYNHHVKLITPSTVNRTTEHQILVVEEEGIDYLSELVTIDVFEEIKRKLGFIDYLNFRTVSHGCRMSAPLSDLPKPELSLPPWSIQNLRGNKIYKFVDPIQNMKYFMTVPEHLVNAKILHSQNGWLLMSNRTSNRMAFYNPFTKDIIRLPNPPQECGFCPTFGFSSSFSNWVCVGLFGIIPGIVDIHYTRRGEDGWQMLQIETNIKFVPNRNSPTLLYGEDGHESFYFLGKGGNLGVFKMDQEDQENGVRWEVLENPKKPCKHYESNFLIECGGELFSVFVGKVGTWVRVFKLNPNQTVWDWEEVTDLGNYMFYISRNSSFSQLTAIPSMANTIYFPKFFEGQLIYYSLHTRRFHYFESGTSMDDAAFQGYANAFDSFYDNRIRGPLYLDWIVLRFS